MRRKTKINHLMHNEKGIAILTSLMMLLTITSMGIAATNLSVVEGWLSVNYRSSKQAFQIADAGIEAARNLLQTNPGALTLTQRLTARVGPNNSLSDSSSIANFYAGGAFVTDDVPFIADTSFGGGSYRVYLTNDNIVSGVGDGITSTTDTNSKVTLVSFGQGPNNSLSIVQAVVQKPDIGSPQGAIVLPGPNVNFDGSNSNASSVAGGVRSAISVNSVTSFNSVRYDPAVVKRLDNYTCNSPPCIRNETIAPPWNSVEGITDLYNTLKSVADSVITGPATLTAAQVGTESNRKIVVVDGAATLGPVDGAGILVVTGLLTLNGNFDYKGLIMCIGEGRLLRNGGGNGTISGSVFVANTKGTSLGISSFDTSGGGNSDIIYNASNLEMPGSGQVYIRRAWKQS